VPFQSVPDSAAGFARVREACEAAGRYPATMTYSVAQTVCCGKDEAEFRRRAAAIGREPEDLRENALGGTPGQVAERIAQFAAIGADRRAGWPVLAGMPADRAGADVGHGAVVVRSR